MTCFPATTAVRCDRTHGTNTHTSNERIQTGVHSTVADLRAPVAGLQHNGASTATALAAAQLGALQAMLGADEVEEGPVGVRIGEDDRGSVEVEGEIRGGESSSQEVLQCCWKNHDVARIA